MGPFRVHMAHFHRAGASGLFAALERSKGVLIGATDHSKTNKPKQTKTMLGWESMSGPKACGQQLSWNLHSSYLMPMHLYGSAAASGTSCFFV